jgi:hypothetical protein
MGIVLKWVTLLQFICAKQHKGNLTNKNAKNGIKSTYPVFDCYGHCELIFDSFILLPDAQPELFSLLFLVTAMTMYLEFHFTSPFSLRASFVATQKLP